MDYCRFVEWRFPIILFTLYIPCEKERDREKDGSNDFDVILSTSAAL